jgi:hypothetical protein
LAEGDDLLPAQKSTPEWRGKHLLTADDFARTLADAELVDKCVQGFRKLRELIPTCERRGGAGRE